MTSREVLKRLAQQGCEVVRQSGSHVIVRCPGGCQTVVPQHRGDLPAGTLRSIVRHLSECIGEEWVR
jgi:predicted RNA binding protein YcfA (HicA-like mRNA interferase family)